MPDLEMSVSAARSSGDQASVFEYDSPVGYFYLVDYSRDVWSRLVGGIRVIFGEPDFTESDISVRWTHDERMVGLFLRGQLWAVFRGKEKFGGDYRPGARPEIPDSVVAAFEMVL
jgi:hypothetical protein